MTKARKKANPSSAKHKSSAESSPGGRLQESAQEPTGAQSVDKIREIIFGNQMQDYDKRFARLEDGLEKKLTELRDATHKRLDSIESFIKKEIEARLVEKNELDKLKLIIRNLDPDETFTLNFEEIDYFGF